MFNHEVYDIGTEILYEPSFDHNSTQKAHFSKRNTDGISSTRSIFWQCQNVIQSHMRHFRKKLNDLVDVELTDYRDVSGKFDKIVSIEMFEAVGEKYWEDYFKILSNN